MASMRARTISSNAPRSPWLARSTIDRSVAGLMAPSDGACPYRMPAGSARFTRDSALAHHSGLDRRRPAPARRRGRSRATLPRMPSTPPLNLDFERRSFWQATMPALPDRSGRPLPDSADVVVIGGGYAGINAARELAARGVTVTLLEAHTLGWGGSTRNGGIVHAGYKWSAPELIEHYGLETGTALYQETLDSYDLVKRLITDEAIDCDFREVGHL